jgi:hypothetical protein
MSSDKRVSIPLKLHPERDADLIAWIEQIERGDRLQPGSGVQSAIKSALRYALGLPDERDALIARQQAEIEALRRTDRAAYNRPETQDKLKRVIELRQKAGEIDSWGNEVRRRA